jgi:sugar lactone lactonase YvrE
MTGELIDLIKMPTSNITCACLGGPDLDWLYITTGRKPGDSNSGALYVAKVKIPGIPESRFCDV